MHWAMGESVALEQIRLSRRARGRVARDGAGAP